MNPERDKGWMIVEGEVVQNREFVPDPDRFPPPVKPTTQVSYAEAAPRVISPREEAIIAAAQERVPEFHRKLGRKAVPEELIAFLSFHGLKALKAEPFNDVFVELESGAPALVYVDEEGRKGLYKPPKGRLSAQAHEMRARLKKEREALLRRGIFKTLEHGGAIIVDEGFVNTLSRGKAREAKAKIGEILRNDRTVEEKAKAIARLLDSPVFVGRKIAENEATTTFFSQQPGEKTPA